MNKIIFSLSLGVISSILALPSGHSVKHGKVKVANRGDQVVVTSGKSAVIHWDKFSVGKGETAKFQMQDSKSSVLNRVTGGNKSEILGRMESNGKVYLINQKGILFGKDCQINVGGLVASTLDALDSDYINSGKMLFDGDSNASIVNLGKISSAGGEVHLLAQKIDNQGSIEAHRVGLGGGSKILIKPKGSERIFVKAGNGSIDHSGSIKAVVTELKTKSAYEMAINCTGSIEGVRANRVKGRIFLSADGGKALVNNHLEAEGGQIRLLGEEMVLAENAHLDVSSANGPGGRIAIGESKEVHSIFVNEGARLDASGSPGGEIYLLAGELEFNGGLRARGFGNSSGGFAEISSVSENYSIIQDPTLFDLSSDGGKHGEILFDPGKITIVVGAASGPCSFGDAFISGVLAGASVTIDSTGQTAPTVTACPSGATPFDIEFAGGVAISWAADTTLTLTADQAINSIGAFSVTNTFVGSPTTPAMVFTGTGTPSPGPTGTFIGVDLRSGTLTSADKDIVITGTGGNLGSLNHGVVLGAVTFTGGGDLTVTGTSVGDLTGSINRGVVVLGTITMLSGTATIMGIGGAGVSLCDGVDIVALPGGTTTSGLFDITGIGGGGGMAGVNNDGVRIEETTLTSTAATFTAGRGITIDGTGGTGAAGSHHGVEFTFGGPTLATDANPISITGVGGSGGSENRGISHAASATVSSTGAGTTGTITYSGTGGSGTDDCAGVYTDGVTTSTIISTVGSDIMITGVPNPGSPATGDANEGVRIINHRLTTVSGNITVNGTGSSAGDADNIGVFVEGSGAVTGFTTTSGNVSLTGDGGAALTTGNDGIRMVGGAEISSTSGTAMLDGTANGGTDDNNGVLISDVGTMISTAGDITITGISDGTGDRNMGVQVSSSALITGTGASEIDIMGTGADGGAGDIFSFGVSFASATLMAGTGDVTVMGTGGDADGECNGINLSSFTFDSSGGVVTFTGIGDGTNARGISIESSSLTADGGSLSMTGTGAGTGSTTMGILMSASMVSSTSSAPINMTGTGSLGAFSEAFGITLFGAGNEVLSDSGKITMRGTGGGFAGGFGLCHGISVAGVGVTGTGSAEVELIGIGGLGGSACAGVAIFSSSLVSTVSGTLTVDGTGGSPDSTTSYGVLADGLGVASIQMSTSDGTLNVIGREGGTDNRGILVTSLGTITSSSGLMNITTLSDLDIRNGGRITGGSSLMTFDIDRDLNITGDGRTSGIFPGSGGVTIATGRDITLTGPDLGAGGGVAQIGNDSAAGVTSDIIFTSVGRNVVVDGFLSSGGSSYSLIGHGGSGAVYGGAIRFLDVLGNVVVQGGDTAFGPVDGFGQIGHLTIFGDTVSGDIAINARGDISVIGGIAAPSAVARIGHGGPGAGVVTASNMTLIANNNITMTSQAGAGQAIISNLSTSAADSLRLVVDNANPAFPNFGAATININAGSDLSTPAGGQLRIYTVQPSQNTITPTINGTAYVPTAFNVDNDTNQYNTYFPGGTYVGGAAFRVYYKTGMAVMTAMEDPFIANRFYCLGEAMGELQDRLPIFRLMRMPENSGATWHHPSFCGTKEACDPGFDPYHSLNFKNDVFWVGETSTAL
ncbi:MAG: filamentous hemagglutinin N-terminal domain-containing protein [Candidatus Algichlamydia australiensis]|nr:filamentous hemagglutinin N-terminal domain-containing protein [Chlamydiales bacterium]